jgi:hypothetical protein
MNNYLGYEVGDQVFIFTRHGFKSGYATKISPSGQVTVEVTPHIRPRFTSTGALIGGGAWSHEHIARKCEQDEAVESRMRAMRLREQRQVVQKECERMHRMDPQHERAELIAGLRALADKLERGP